MRYALLVSVTLALALALGAAASAATLYDFGAGGSVDYAATPAEPAPAPKPSGSLPLGVEEQVSVTMSPRVPKAGDSVTIRVDSYSTNLSKASTVWQEGGAVVAQGTGIVEYTFVAPQAGDSTTVTFRAIKEGGGTIERSFTVAPADVDILWEAQTYTPPFYRGKALFTNSAAIKFVADPNFVVDGVRLDPENLVYTWRVNGSVIQSASGYSRQTFTTRGALVVLGVNVEVEVSAPGSDAAATNRQTVRYASPLLLHYRKDPLLGVLYEETWSNLTKPLVGGEVTLLAAPYFFDAPAARGGLAYSWFVNGAASDQEEPLATFRKEGGGIASVDTEVKSVSNFAQFAEARALVDLGESTTTAPALPI